MSSYLISFLSHHDFLRQFYFKIPRKNKATNMRSLNRFARIIGIRLTYCFHYAIKGSHRVLALKSFCPISKKWNCHVIEFIKPINWYIESKTINTFSKHSENNFRHVFRLLIASRFGYKNVETISYSMKVEMIFKAVISDARKFLFISANLLKPTELISQI